MEVYVARDRETKMLIGIFVAKGVGDLCGLIAEFTNPLVCEVLELGTGGIFFQKKISISPPDFGDVTVTDFWSQSLAGSKDWTIIKNSHFESVESE
jgi:hypothetical protein